MKTLLAALVCLALSACCGAQNAADTEWLRDDTCWIYTQLTEGSKTDPYGDKFQQEQLDRRVKLLRERMERKHMTCNGVAY